MISLLLLAQAIAFAPAPAKLDFVLQNNPTPQKHMLETMAGGLAIFDYDGDGKPDLFFANGASLPSLKKDAPGFSNRLYRNEGNWKFRDVTREAGLAGEGYANGASAADFDNDGLVDLFIAGVYRNTLYRNLGNGRFEDVTAKSGIRQDEWSAAAGWFDFDRDGLLDLLVVNYGRIDLAAPRFCGDATRGLRVYCHPKYFEPRPNHLYRNRGGGMFEDVTVSSGIGKHLGRGMSVAFADYDGDGLQDIFVTNDNLPNFLFRNLGSGKFEETALLAGVALLDHGKAVASMGTDFRDYDNDGRPDLIVTALNGETFPVFRNLGGGSFQDAGYASQLARQTNGYAGWGVALADFDNDGLKDLFTANAHVNDIVEKFEGAVYRQPNTVFRNVGNGKFSLVANSGLENNAAAHRGAAFADLDGDGKLDAVVTVLGQAPELWRNVSSNTNHWLEIRLRGVRSNRDGVGARVRIGPQSSEMTSSVSYASSALIPVHFGLGADGSPKRVEVLWPSGARQIVESVKPDQILLLTEPAEQ